MQPVRFADRASRWRDRFGPANRLIILLTAAFAVSAMLAGAAGFTIWNTREQALRSAESEMNRLSLLVAEDVERVIQGVDTVLDTWVTRGVARDASTEDAFRAYFASPQIAHDLRSNIEGWPQVSYLAVLDADGAVLTSSASASVAGIELADRDAFLEPRSGSDTALFISRPVVSRISHDWILNLSRRVSAPDGRFLGVIVAAIGLRHFEDLFQTAAPPGDGIVALWRSDGSLIARYPRAASQDGTSMADSPMLIEGRKHADAGPIHLITRAPGTENEITRSLVSRSIGAFPLLLNVSNAHDVIFADWRRQSLIIGGLASASVLAITLSVLLLSRLLNAHVREATLTQLQLVADNVPALIASHDADDRFTFINKTGERWLARPASEIIGRTIDEIMSSKAAVSIEHLLSERSFRCECTATYPDGKLRTVDVVAVPQRNFRGVFDGYYTLITDVSERTAFHVQLQQLNASLEQSLERFQSVTDNLPALIAYVDAERKFQFVNKTAEAWFARPAREIIGRTTTDILEEPLSRSTEELFAGWTRVRKPIRFEQTTRYPDGKTRTTDVINIPDHGPDGELRGYYCLATDITKRREAAELLHQSQKMDAIGKLTGGMAHDFNNLLAIIAGNIELILETLDCDDDRRRRLTVAHSAAQHGAKLTRSLLSFARRQTLRPELVDVNQVVADIIELIRSTMPENIEIGFAPTSGLGLCLADPHQLQNALLNLVVNARDAMPQGGRLTIATQRERLQANAAEICLESRPGDYVVLEISDTGSGMPPEVVKRAAEPFYTTKSPSQGTGLGLSMVYGFAKQSGGWIELVSELGRGTTARIHLPEVRQEIEERRRPTTAPAGTGESIVVAEDNADVRRMASDLLRSLGYDVSEAETPDDALRQIRDADVAVLLTDVVLPGDMNGPELADEALRLRPDLKILFMSGYAEDALGDDAPDRSIELLRKPFTKSEIAAAVRRVLDPTLAGKHPVDENRHRETNSPPDGLGMQ